MDDMTVNLKHLKAACSYINSTQGGEIERLDLDWSWGARVVRDDINVAEVTRGLKGYTTSMSPQSFALATSAAVALVRHFDGNKRAFDKAVDAYNVEQSNKRGGRTTYKVRTLASKLIATPTTTRNSGKKSALVLRLEACVADGIITAAQAKAIAAHK